MFINDLKKHVTEDPDTGARLECLRHGGGEEDRPCLFALTVGGETIPFHARPLNMKNPADGSAALCWRVGWIGIRGESYKIADHRFASEEEYHLTQATIAEALRVYRMFTFDTRPVLSIIFTAGTYP